MSQTADQSPIQIDPIGEIAEDRGIPARVGMGVQGVAYIGIQRVSEKDAPIIAGTTVWVPIDAAVLDDLIVIESSPKRVLLIIRPQP